MANLPSVKTQDIVTSCLCLQSPNSSQASLSVQSCLQRFYVSQEQWCISYLNVGFGKWVAQCITQCLLFQFTQFKQEQPWNWSQKGEQKVPLKGSPQINKGAPIHHSGRKYWHGFFWYSVLSNKKCCRSSDGRLKRVDFVLAWDTDEPEVLKITTMVCSIPIPMGHQWTRGIKHYNNGLHNTNTKMNTNGTPMNQRYWTLQQWSTQYQ